MTDGGPALCMLDEQGRKRLELSDAAAGSELHLLDANEFPIAI